jgi:tetratricopeptide (TPR) repeat protein
MAAIPNNPRLTLRFVGKEKPALRATEFSPPKIMGEQHPPYRCTEGKSGEGQFEWREGVQALCICLIKYLCCPKSILEKGVKFQFEGGRHHPAKTLDGNIAKANKANCWLQNIFRTDGEGACRIKKFIQRKNPNPTAKKPNYLLEIQHEELPQGSITIELDGKIITDTTTLEKTADAIEDQWYEIKPQYKSEWGKIKEARELRNKSRKTKKTKRRNLKKLISDKKIEPLLRPTETMPAESDAANVIYKPEIIDANAKGDSDHDKIKLNAADDFVKNAMMSKLCEPTPKDAAKYAFRPYLKLSNEDLNRALAVCCKAIELFPANPSNYINRGNVKLTQGDLDGALSDYCEAIQLDRKYGAAYSGRGNVKLAKGDPSGALADFKKAKFYDEDEWS